MTQEFKERAILLAKDLESFFDRDGYALYLAYGTLLGAIREKRIISNDDDLDFIIVANSSRKEDIIQEIKEIAISLKRVGLLSKIFVRRGWLWENQIKSQEDIIDPTGQIHIKGRGVAIDLWVDSITEDGQYMNGCFGNFGPASQFINFNYPKTVVFEGQEFQIPDSAELMLSLIYGDWRTPRNEKRGKGMSKRNDFLLQ